MSPNNAEDARRMKAVAICEENRIEEKPDGSFNVPSQSKQGTFYEVRLLGQTWVALDGQTPAESAGIGVQEKNKWLELLSKSLVRGSTNGIKK